jgi:DNA-binding NarL/FixJ family response regulator
MRQLPLRDHVDSILFLADEARMIRVLVVDDHTLVREGVCRLLEGQEDLHVVGQAGSGREGVRLCRELRPDVVVLDYSLPDIDGLEATRQIVAAHTGTRVLVLTMHASEEYAARVLGAGGAGFVVKVAAAEELVAAVRKVAAAGVYVSPSLVDRVLGRIHPGLETPPEAALSDRELQVLILLASGATSREVCGKLALSLSTVETYRSRVLQKLGLRNNSDMTRFAIRRQLIENE